MTTFANGRAPSTVLTRASNGHTFTKAAAAAFDRVAAAFEARFKKPLTVTQGYRTYAEQRRIFEARYRPQIIGRGPYGDVRWWNGRRYVRVTGSAAAIPGTSNHGWGVAADLNTRNGFGDFDTPEYKWLATHGPAYGWTNTEGRAIREPWHWVYNAKNDRHAKPTPTTSKGLAAMLPTIHRKNNTKKATRTAQALLTARGFPTSVDGKWGNQTDRNTAAFQKANGLTQDKVIGPKTWPKLIGA